MKRETAVYLLSYSANQQAVNRVRGEQRPKMAEPTSLTGFELPLALQKTQETAVYLPSYSANQQAVKRVRREQRPKMAEPTSLTGFELPLALQKTQ